MGKAKEALINMGKFMEQILSVSLYQVFLAMCSGFAYLFIGFGLGRVFYNLGLKSMNWNIIIYIIVGLIVSLMYGAGWLTYWKSLYNGGIKWFYFRIVFSILPLILVLKSFNPVVDPDSMVLIPAETIFSCLVSGIFLTPIYSVLIYKFILQKPLNKKRNAIIVGIITLLIGVPIAVASWKFMPIFYEGI